jgi:hypothetical protein
MGNCGKRAFEAGLRWAGILADVGNPTNTDHLTALANKYGLHYITFEDLPQPFGNRPALVIYQANYEGVDSENHAVFASDLGPFVRWPIHSVVIGWENLRPRPPFYRRILNKVDSLL